MIWSFLVPLFHILSNFSWFYIVSWIWIDMGHNCGWVSDMCSVWVVDRDEGGFRMQGIPSWGHAPTFDDRSGLQM
jgi:hypothetical protein